MMKTRSATKKEEVGTRENPAEDKTPTGVTLTTENQLDQTITVEVAAEAKFAPAKSRSSQSTKSSSSSSIAARRRTLVKMAAQERARIQMDLVDQNLQIELAGLEEENYSPTLSKFCAGSQATSKSERVETWVKQSQHELESQRANKKETLQGTLCQSEGGPTGTNGPIQQLTNALKELITTSATSSQNANLLSRISTPKELPWFSGDPMEWLQFKQAYEESTRVCNFSDTENLWRLRKCLRGPAREAVTALLISATSSDIVMSTLALQFGNPEIILSRILHDIKKMNPMSQDYHKDIVSFSVKIQNYVAAVRALGRYEHLQGMEVASIVLSKLPTVLLSKWADYSYPLIVKGIKNRLDVLSDFLREEAVKISTCSAALINVRTDTYKRKTYDHDQQPHTILLQSEGKDDKCRYCRMSKHKLTECKKFKKALRKDRWLHVKRNGICYKCLVANHDRLTCTAPACDKDGCGQAHHSLLHYVPNKGNQQDNNNAPPVKKTDTETQTEIITHLNVSTGTVLLKVVPINIHGPKGIFSTNALLDDGSTVSLISADLAERVGICGRRESLRVRGAWDNTELVCDSHLIDLTMSNKENGMMFTTRVRSVNNLNLPKQDLCVGNCEDYVHLQKIKHKLCNEQLKPEMLIGQDNYHLLLPEEIVMGGANEPCASRTPLGWCLHGRTPARMTSLTGRTLHSTLFISEDDDTSENKLMLQEIHEEVRRSFAIDSMGVSAKPRQNSEDVRAWDYLERSSSLVDGKWQVGLPWKDENCVMPDSYPTAIKRLRSVELKMQKCDEYAQRYKDRIKHLFDNDYAKEIHNVETTPKTWYLPHFGVDNPNKKKLRLVFDAAATTNGRSLNDYLLKGPDLLMSLFGIMLRFRENKIAVTGDIKDMFLRVKIRSEDQNALRFMYRDDPKGPLKINAMTSLIFGANCSPFIAQFVKNKNARQYESSMPAAAAAICTQHYMDDYIDSLPDEETAIKVIRDVTFIHKQGNFEIRGWTSNSEAVINSVPKETLGPSAVRFKDNQQHEGERILGLIWHPIDDTLGFDVSFKKIPEAIVNGKQRPTKREMLRVVMSIFDVFGFVSPFTIIGKIILQDTWQSNIGWDEYINDNIYNKWCKWTDMLKTLHRVRLPRYYRANAERASELNIRPTLQSSESTSELAASTPMIKSGYTNLEMHIFCDASTKAMCAVAYWRWKENDKVYVAFIASRCRVAPVKFTSVPRLELQAAVLAARLAETIKKEHKMIAQKTYFWCDSTTVLHWIRNTARNYKAYVAHRLGEIDELTQTYEWRYIPTKINVADIATRENCDLSVFESEWLHGPRFLYEAEDSWPLDNLIPAVHNEDLECVTTLETLTECLPAVPEPERFSSWLRLLKSTCMVLSFVDKCRKRTGEVNSDVMARAECLLIKYSQTQSFAEELDNLKNKKVLNKKSKLLTVSPFLDTQGVLRVGGRIDAAADVSPEIKQPVILDSRNHVAMLIVRHYHIKAAHGNQETVVNNLKQKYWLTRIRPAVKRVAAKCMYCRIKKANPQPPRMGDLPGARMAHHHRPFSFCGLDLFGPMDVSVGRRREKRYGVIFTCLTVRAVHIEIVTRLTSDALIMALRRMAARRGWPLHLYSDNGTNMRGADTELKKSILELDQNILKSEAVNYGTTWNFIPPASPHWGGAWERLIRTIKSALKVTLNEHAPRDEVLFTLMTEVEQMVNSRPLTHVTVEPKSNETLTPNHFLIGSSSNLPVIGKFENSDLNLRKQWRISQALADAFWRRWIREVLPDMLPRRKWQQDHRPLQVGDLVLIVDPDSPRNVWPKGLVQAVLPGKDGRVRMVDVKTKSGVLRRSAARIAFIPTGDEC